ncbi:MAG: nucleotide exchange factor GrpE [Pirellulales bacterium]
MADSNSPRGDDAGVAAPENLVEQLRAEAAEANDRALRAHAELENFRKRARRDADDERKYANLPLLRDLLPVLDNLTRALEAGEKTHDAGKLIEGVKLVSQQLDNVFGNYQCKRIPALGEPFDPNVHQAIAQQPSADQPPGTVLLEAQSGYQLHDRVLRPSQVIVSRAND